MCTPPPQLDPNESLALRVWAKEEMDDPAEAFDALNAADIGLLGADVVATKDIVRALRDQIHSLYPPATWYHIQCH